MTTSRELRWLVLVSLFLSGARLFAENLEQQLITSSGSNGDALNQQQPPPPPHGQRPPHGPKVSPEQRQAMDACLKSKGITPPPPPPQDGSRPSGPPPTPSAAEREAFDACRQQVGGEQSIVPRLRGY